MALWLADLAGRGRANRQATYYAGLDGQHFLPFAERIGLGEPATLAGQGDLERVQRGPVDVVAVLDGPAPVVVGGA